jgi:opacity protein-like surface antigen
VDTARTSNRTLDSAIVSDFAVLPASGCPNCNNQQILPYPGGAPNATTTQTGRIDSKIDELGTLRAKAGFAPAREFLMYGTGGLAWAHSVTTLTATQTVSGTVVAAVPASGSLPSSFGYGAVQHHVVIQRRVRPDLTRLVGWRRRRLETHAELRPRRSLSSL